MQGRVSASTLGSTLPSRRLQIPAPELTLSRGRLLAPALQLTDFGWAWHPKLNQHYCTMRGLAHTTAQLWVPPDSLWGPVGCFFGCPEAPNIKVRAFFDFGSLSGLLWVPLGSLFGCLWARFGLACSVPQHATSWRFRASETSHKNKGC